MLQNIDLRSLAEIRGNGRDVVSAYFDADEGLKSLATRERAIHDMLADDPLEVENFERSMETMRALLAEHAVYDAKSICFYCSEILDLAHGYPISMDVRPQLVVGPSPYIRPLAELQDDYETFLIVACDNDRTRIFSVTNETAEVEQAVKGGIKNHVRKGGWSQQRYERRRDEQLARYGKDIADELSELIRNYNIARLVLIGSDETMRAIEEQMPDQMVELIVGRESFDLHRPEDELLEKAYESYFDEGRQIEKDVWQRIKNEALGGGRAVTGAGETFEAAKVGRVEEAVVTRKAKIVATKCRDCEDTKTGKNTSCKACGSKNVFSIDFIDALARHLELTSADIHFVDPIPGLTKCGDVAAMLRF